MTARHYQHLFGPVPSRRLGRSLGVDLTPFKTCSFDCIFCQLGRTTNKTVKRQEYIPVKDVITELDAWLKTGDRADFITLSGSGEPTLNAQFGRVIDFVRRVTTIPVALLTNGSLLSDPDVRAQAAQANVVKVSLSAWDPFSFNHINRPHADIKFKQLIEGLWLLRKGAKGNDYHSCQRKRRHGQNDIRGKSGVRACRTGTNSRERRSSIGASPGLRCRRAQRSLVRATDVH